MILHTIRRLAHASAIVSVAFAASLATTAHAADTGTADNAGFAFDVTELMGGGSLRFSDSLFHSLQTVPVVTVAPIILSGDVSGTVAAPITTLSGSFETPSTSPQVVKSLSIDLSTGTLFGNLENGSVLSLATAHPSLMPVPKPSTPTPPPLSIANLPALDLSLFTMYGPLASQPKPSAFLVWQTADGAMHSSISLDVSPIPEASSMALMALGLAGLGLLKLRRNT